MGLANGPISTIIQKIIRNKKAVKQWKSLHILIIDEISMMSKKIFEIIEQTARTMKKCSLPFGGMQVIFTGDFYQLPPVGTPLDEDSQLFCFESDKWLSVFSEENHVELTTIFRQQNDEIYKCILNQVRIGELDEEGIQILQSCVGKEIPINTEKTPTKIYAIRAKTDYVNKNMYAKIDKPEHVYEYQTRYNLTTYLENGKLIDLPLLEYCKNTSQEILENEANNLMNSSNRQSILRLKEGAKVMCLHNIDLTRDICNGSQGVVVKFIGENNIPVVRFQNGVEIMMETVWVQSEEFPTVAVSQIPLCLAWALTIHKIQGATLMSAEMDLGNSVFEYGQTYVALSRIKSIDGLYLSAFEPTKIRANPIVKTFYKKIGEYKLSRPLQIYSTSMNIFTDYAYKEEKYIESTEEKQDITTRRIYISKR